jgi:hypothetical protein
MDSYKESIFEPLEYYTDYGKNAHNDNIKEYFDALVEKSGIDTEENKKTVAKYKGKKANIDALNKKLKRNKRYRIFSIVGAIALFIAAMIIVFSISLPQAVRILIPIFAICVGAALIVLAFKATKSKIKSLQEKIKKEEEEALAILREAEAQMAPLNALFSDADTYNLIEKTMPQIKFDKQFVFENLEDLKNNYDFNGNVGPKSSVFDVVSGKLYKNPFLFERFVTETMSTHTYTGTLLISWVTYERDSNGKTVPRRRTQTLIATVTKPKPIYNVSTLLSYGSQAAPDLSFSRENKHFEDLSEKQVERKVKKGEKKLKKKAEKALSKGNTFTEMSNTKFDVLFDATNRDNEQQFRLLFTPLAQREMIDLIRSEEGYGDDFDFFKKKKLNIIRSEHAEKWDMCPSATKYYSYDFEAAKKKFFDYNNEYFKSVYFDFAPLIAIPSYQEPPTAAFEDISQSDSHYTEYNYEAVANKMGAFTFAHPATKTDVILKTELIKRTPLFDTVAVTAYSYSAEHRTDFVPTLGGDGRMHLVPVPWIEYIPLQKTSLMSVKNIGISETEYQRKASSIGDILAPQNATCMRGIFAHTDLNGTNANKFINLITK